MITLLAVGLAVLGACFFAVAATLQHRAVGEATEGRALSMDAFRSLFRRPGWLLGLGSAGLGAGLGMAALMLAPVSVIQPIGIISVPIAVLLAARRSGSRPTRGMLIGIGLSVVAIATFVAITAGTAVTTFTGGSALVLTSAAIAAVVAILALLSRTGPAWLRCAASAGGGATAFGLMTVLVKAAAEQVVGNLAMITQPSVLALLAGIVIALAVGGWLTQQAFASGPPELVLACLTVVDPLVAVVLGTLLLGEGAQFAPSTVAMMVVCAGAAAAGVIALGKYHPDVIARASESPVGPAHAPSAHAPSARSKTSSSRKVPIAA